MLTRRSKYCRMSFNVTQCPACESTFNTNSRVLAAAEGRVRCGACLNVFEAIDNFLVTEEADETLDRDESVFVGNDPQEYFDPSSFLTRSALREGQDAPPDEQHLHQMLDQSQPLSEEFFTSVVEELHGREGAPEAVEGSTPDLESAPVSHEERYTQNDAEAIDEEFEEGILDSFTTLQSEAGESLEREAIDSPAEEAFAAEAESAAAVETKPPPQTDESFLGPGLSASFTFDPRALREERRDEPEPGPLPDQATAGEQSIESSGGDDATIESGAAAMDYEELSPTTETQYLGREADAALESEEVPADFTRAESSSIDAAEPDFAAATTADPFPIADPGDAPESIAPAVTDAEIASDELASPTAESHDAPTADIPKAPAEGTTETEAEQGIEAKPASLSEMDDESTEAIRARALEAELSDDEALEAIPRENLAALGRMSTPLEFLARKESRLLRSTFLFLSILLLGGLLSAQYLWQGMQLYSQLPHFRPLYEVACGYLNCELPVYTDIDSIRSENLSVQTHPSFANGLMVNTVIRNTAAFEQPFPVLILSFNSAENSVIALREFTSAEYLDPGLRGIRSMPAMTPVQIGLEIMDPGPEAVNYTLAFRWP